MEFVFFTALGFRVLGFRAPWFYDFAASGLRFYKVCFGCRV